jgi:hypothetical protein
MKKILSILCVFIILSCNSIAKKVYGVKKPTFQTIENQKIFLNKYGLIETDFFYYKDLKSFASASKENYLSVPDAFFFNKKGEYVPYKKTSTECNAKVGDFIKDLETFNNSSSENSIKIENFLKLLNNDTEIKIEKSEIVVFLTWAVFAGKTNKIKTFDWINLIENAKKNGINISYYLVNCDLQENWNLSLEQKKTIKKILNK